MVFILGGPRSGHPHQSQNLFVTGIEVRVESTQKQPVLLRLITRTGLVEESVLGLKVDKEIGRALDGRERMGHVCRTKQTIILD